ncbi:MAG: low molecular weight protein-tyrosine-phosphatase [Thiofilum sp.]|uniref:low molecular weight protein-tyrosine-phosphatase n=1 Tax=Thiofilum sp. TaxID=2212733 RepID=UPI0025FB02D7|nr:low molecular weight protein-tyrosine-phosphatase [Thiofilum sp.]MBK8455161.1 low molecular weight phosphotyrosine protein phosphatase [Thiofilum sp.]
MAKIKVLMVCMGNICRSPTAQGVLEAKLVQRGWQHYVFVDSAGTHAYHTGSPPDKRSQQAALRRGIDLSEQRARLVNELDFAEFDYVLAMDMHNLQYLQRTIPAMYKAKLRLLLSFAPQLPEFAEVPDPYYGGENGFERVLDLIEEATEGLLADIEQRLNLAGR